MTTATADAPAVTDAPPERPDDEILDELRERRQYAARAWADIREEGRKDVMCVAGDVWSALEPDGLDARRKAGRPAISCDELGQYINQVGNDVRQNKRSIRATPIAMGADEKTADYRQARIRQIEYRSNAQRDVYSPIFEDALQRSYGFGRVVAKYVSDTTRNQELLIEAFPNPDVVLVDPDGAMLSPDCAKIQYAFILDASRTRKQFKRDFPQAQVLDFTEEHGRIAPDWIHGEHITLAEYWEIERVMRRVVFLKIDPSRGFFAHKLPRPPRDVEIDDERMVPVPYVCQYLTNGVELLVPPGGKKRTPWRGKSIPLFSCFGKVLYVQNGTGTERRMLSMVRLPRQPVMGLAYAQTCKIETLGSVPRTTWVGYEGQFRGHETEWQKANHEPVPYLVVKPFTEATGGQILPLPERQSWDPPLQNIELACESFRRSIQAAMGTSPLPTEAQRVNQKSGKALDRIEASGQKGSYHFVDHLDGMITRVGVLLDELLPFYDDTMGEVTIRKPDDQAAQQRINDPNDPDAVMVSADQQHDITISVGPYAADEREASSEFADTIITNPQLAQTVGPEKFAKMTALAIRLKGVGPIGDEMADIIDPEPPQAGAPPTPEQVQSLQAELQAAQQQLQQAGMALETEQAKQAATVESARLKAEADAAKAQADVDVKLEIARIESETELEKVRLQEATKLEVAELTLRGKAMQVELDAMQAKLGIVQQAATMAHTSDEAAAARESQAEGADAERAHASEMAEAQRAADARAAEGAQS
jgi:hypothetical protein